MRDVPFLSKSLILTKKERPSDYEPAGAREHVIEGGNHAQFGSYGPQQGDGEPLVSAEEQVEETVTAIAEMVGGSDNQ